MIYNGKEQGAFSKFLNQWIFSKNWQTCKFVNFRKEKKLMGESLRCTLCKELHVLQITLGLTITIPQTPITYFKLAILYLWKVRSCVVLLFNCPSELISSDLATLYYICIVCSSIANRQKRCHSDYKSALQLTCWGIWYNSCCTGCWWRLLSP